jgi:ribonuclease P protein component
VSYTILKKRSDFVRVAAFKNMTRAKTVWVQLMVNKNDEKSSVRVGYTASRKTGNAVQRNRAKRRMRNLVCCNLNELLIDIPNFSGDFVIIGIPATVTCEYSNLVSDFKSAVNNCLRRIKLTNL